MSARAWITTAAAVAILGLVLLAESLNEPEVASGSSVVKEAVHAVHTLPVDTAHASGTRLDERHWFGDGVAFRNLTVWPIFGDGPGAFDAYLTLQEAVSKELASIEELGASRVSRVLVRNDASEAILVCAGTLIRGGKQDRVVASDVVVPSGKSVEVPVACVERGRWDDTREGRPSNGKFTLSDWKATKRVRVNAQYKGNQREVWRQTKAVKRVLLEDPAVRAADSLGGQYYLASTLASQTGSLFNALDHGAADSRAMRRAMAAAVDDWFDALPERPVGFAYAIDGEPVTVRTFANSDLLARRFGSFVSAMCLEAEVAQRSHLAARRPIHDTPASIHAVLALVEGLRHGTAKVEPLGDDCRVAKLVNGYGGRATTSVRLGSDPAGEWVELTRDWTAPVHYSQEALRTLGKLQALGYTR